MWLKIVGRKILHISCSHIFVHTSPRAREIKKKINKWEYIKLKSFCTVKEIINKIKRQPTECENMFTNATSDQVLVSKIYKEFVKINTKKNMQSN